MEIGTNKAIVGGICGEASDTSIISNCISNINIVTSILNPTNNNYGNWNRVGGICGILMMKKV